MPKNISVALVLSTLLAAGGVVGLGCRHEGPAEKLGEKIDGHDDSVSDKLHKDRAGESAGKKIDRAVDDITK
jgi:hypothetical protein